MIVNSLNKQHKINKDKVCLSLLIIMIILPGTLSFGFISYPMYFTGILIIISLCLNLASAKNIFKQQKNFVITNVFLALVMLVITIFNICSGRVNFNLNLLFDSVKIISYGLFVILTIFLCQKKENFIFALKFSCIAFVLISLLGISQYFDIFSLNEKYIHLFAEKHAFNLNPGSLARRIVGSKSNPNVLGTVICFSFILDIIYLKYSRKKWFFIASICIKFYALMLTMSRTSLAAAIASIFVFLLVFFYFKFGIKKSIKVIFLFFIIGIFLLLVLPKNLTFRITEMVNISSLQSWVFRVIKWEDFFVLIKDNPITGIGQVKNLDVAVDSEWVQIILEYGIVGLISYCSFIFIPFIECIKRNISKNALIIGCYSYFIISTIFCNVANVTVWNVEISYVMFFILGIILSLDSKEEIFEYSYLKKQELINNPNKKNKILVLAPYFPPCGGIGVFRITKFVKYLPDFNYESVIVTFSESAYTNKDTSLLKNLDKNQKVIHIDKKKSFINDDGIAFYLSLKEEIDNIITNEMPDLVLATGGPFMYFPITRYIKSKYKIPYIIDLRDPWTLAEKNSFANKYKVTIFNFLSEIFEKYTLLKANAILTVNDTMTNDYKNKYRKIASNFYTITNGYDPEDFQDLTPIKLEGFTIIYTGKFLSAGDDYNNQPREFRNPHLVLKAMKEIINEGKIIKFIHIGNKETAIENMITDLGLENYCKMIGFKSYHETLEYCKGASLLLLIGGESKCEQTGKIFDYIGANKPILCLCNKDSEIKVVANKSPLAITLEKNNYIGIKNEIQNMMEGTIHTSIECKELTRYELTKKLNTIIKRVIN